MLDTDYAKEQKKYKNYDLCVFHYHKSGDLFSIGMERSESFDDSCKHQRELSMITSVRRKQIDNAAKCWKLIFLLTSFALGPVRANILVVGSANADTFLPVARLPTEGENLTLLPGKQPVVDLPGGKGCTQAVAASKLTGKSCRFVGQLGSDTAAKVLLEALQNAGVDSSDCGIHENLPSGRGYVFLSESGSVSAVVSGGSNACGWIRWKEAWEKRTNNDRISDEELDKLLDGVDCILLQREVPEYVNLLIATRAKQRGNILVFQDVGKHKLSHYFVK